MAFAPGDRVHLAGLGTGSVLEARGGNRYAIEIKGRVVIASARDLQRADVSSSSRSSRHGARRDGNADVEPASRAHVVPALDLHGRTVDEAIAAVEVLISDALVSGHAEVRIIHGRGSGRVKAGVHRYLRQLSAVAAFRLDPTNPGVTIVNFA